MDPQEFEDLLRLGRESRRVEFKESQPWGEHSFKLKITRAVLALSNLRDGGWLIIGVAQDGDGSLVRMGLLDAHKSSYNFDDIQRFISDYADPYVRFQGGLYQHTDSRWYAIIHVQEFAELPVICRKDATVLRQGAVYVRSHRKPESAELPSQTEMRELLNLAIEKGIRNEIARLRELGLIGHTLPPPPTSAEKYELERGDL